MYIKFNIVYDVDRYCHNSICASLIRCWDYYCYYYNRYKINNNNFDLHLRCMCIFFDSILYNNLLLYRNTVHKIFSKQLSIFLVENLAHLGSCGQVQPSLKDCRLLKLIIVLKKPLEVSSCINKYFSDRFV